MIRTGLESVTFRELSIGEVVDLAGKAGLEAIEWGANGHVPHGEMDLARQAAELTSQAGLKVSSYGSYYRIGHDEPAEFEAVLATAEQLGVKMIRVWGGYKGSSEDDGEYRRQVVAESRRIGDLAAASGVTLAYEFHSNTLTDTNDSALRLLKDVEHDSVRTYWQPPVGMSRSECLAGIEMISPWLANVHVTLIDPQTYQPMALSSGADDWLSYLKAIAAIPGDRFAMIEFVKDAEAENFLADAETLKGWLTQL